MDRQITAQCNSSITEVYSEYECALNSTKLF